MDKSRLGQC